MTDAVKAHYDAVGTQSQKARSLGGAYALKKYHNEVKRALLQKYTSPGDRLLDVACGRGGDIPKWLSLKLGRVKGLDVSEAEIGEARHRWAHWKQKIPGPTECTFEARDALDLQERDGSYNVVTCMFALHYFWGCRDHAERLLGLVADTLVTGGTFVGTVVNATKVKAHVGDHLKLEPLWRAGGTGDSFGCEYRCVIGDTVMAGSSEAVASEYLVPLDSLRAVGTSVGLELVEYTPFKPTYPPGTHPDLWKASELYAIFAFKKNRLSTVQ